MKKLVFLFMVVAATFFSCSEETENLAPEFVSVELSSNNQTATVTFSEPVYATATKTGNLTDANILVEIDGVDFTYTVTHTAGATTLTIELTITSITTGTEMVKVSPVNATSIYDAEGLAMPVSAEVISEALIRDMGIIGKWYSSGTNVAPLLRTYFNVDSIHSEFKENKSYIVKQFNVGNTSGTPDVTFTGTFTLAKSNVGEIWTIVIAQVTPYEAVASGIFEIKTNPEVLWYEVAQTSGTQNVPPTPEGGFGSTNGGTLGAMNIQKYIRIP
jgi:hypothetical protein